MFLFIFGITLDTRRMMMYMKNHKLQKDNLIEKCNQLYGKDKLKKIWIENPEDRLNQRASNYAICLSI